MHLQGEWIVLDDEPRESNDVVTIETIADRTAGATRVRVVARRPVIRNGQVLHELTLSRLAQAERRSGEFDESMDEPQQERETLATLTRHISVRVLNCSAEGCLFEATGPLAVGTVAALRCRSRESSSTNRFKSCGARPGTRRRPPLHRGAISQHDSRRSKGP